MGRPQKNRYQLGLSDYGVFVHGGVGTQVLTLELDTKSKYVELFPSGDAVVKLPPRVALDLAMKMQFIAIVSKSNELCDCCYQRLQGNQREAG